MYSGKTRKDRMLVKSTKCWPSEICWDIKWRQDFYSIQQSTGLLRSYEIWCEKRDVGKKYADKYWSTKMFWDVRFGNWSVNSTKYWPTKTSSEETKGGSIPQVLTHQDRKWREKRRVNSANYWPTNMCIDRWDAKLQKVSQFSWVLTHQDTK